MLSIGIDVSKGKSTVCGMKPGGEIVYAPFEVQHTREGMSELVSLLRSSGEEVRAVLESTGSYHCPVVAALLENGIFVSVVNSLRMKRFCSQSIRKVKTDRIDAMQIALYGLAYWQELQPARLPEDTYRELQLLARQYYQMTSLLIKAKVDFNAIRDQVLPGMQELMSDHAGRHKLSDFVLRYRHTTHILEMGETRFQKDYCKWAEKKGYRNCERMAAHIFATAQNGIPVLPNAHILDEDRKVNAQKFESAFYANPDLRGVQAPAEPAPALDVQSIILQLQQSPELLSALTSLISNQGCK